MKKSMKPNHEHRQLWMFVSLMVVTACLAGPASRNARAQEQAKEEQTKEETLTQTKRVAATVNGKPIFEEQLKPAVDVGLRRFKKYGMQNAPPGLVKRIKERTLNNLIGDELVHQESRKLTVENLDEKIQQKVDELKSKHGAGERFERYLEMRRLTVEDLKESFRVRVRLDEYLKQQGILEPEIPEERLKEFYDSNPKNYAVEEAVKVSHVLIKVEPTADADQKEQARQKAEKLRKEILDGKDFGEMAKEHSDCNSAAGGGVLRRVERGYMPKEFETVAFAMEIDAVSEVVETKYGFHIIKLFEKRPEGVAPFENVKDFIKRYMQEKESKKKLAEHTEELKKQAKIEIFLDES